MRALVIGSEGFAGRYLVAELEKRGHEVVKTTVDPGEHSLLTCDVTDPSGVERALSSTRPDGIIVLAGIAYAPDARKAPVEAFRVHVMGLVHVISAAERLARPPKIVVVTSSEVYGSIAPDAVPIEESHPLRPATIYGASKAAADLTAAGFCGTYPGGIVRVRPFNHTGPGQRRDFVCPDFARQVARISRRLRPPVLEVGNVDVVRDFSDVRDIVRGYADALERGGTGEVYNLCSGAGTSVRAVIDRLAELAGCDLEIRVQRERVRPGEIPIIVGSRVKAERELGWQPRIALRQTLQDLLGEALGEAEPTALSSV